MSAVLSDLITTESKPELAKAEIAPRISRSLREARVAQLAWAGAPIRHRLKVLRRFRHRLASHADDFTSTVSIPQRRNEAETLAAEIIPLADACKWLELEGASVLAPRRLSKSGRPTWLRGVQITERRDPHGIVLIIGTWNYPLFLVGVQVAQALAAGNAVILKPGRDGFVAADLLRESLIKCGLDSRLLTVLPEDAVAAEAAIEAGVDKVVLTGSADTGRRVLEKLSAQLTPADMELSGCDSVFVRGDANLELAVKALVFGMTINASATCIAPRRVFVHRSIAAELQSRLSENFGGMPAAPVPRAIANRLSELVDDAVNRGATLLGGAIQSAEEDDLAGDEALVRPLLLAGVPIDAELLRADLFAPVLSLVPVGNDEEALLLDKKCPYALGATVFGRSDAALELAAKVDAGCVVVNDLLVPTADPRLSFGGRRQSGYGVTRGAAGLLAMTLPKTIVEQTLDWRPYLDPTTPDDAEFFKNYLAAAHGRNWRSRLRAGISFLQEAYRRQRNPGSTARQKDQS